MVKDQNFKQRAEFQKLGSLKHVGQFPWWQNGEVEVDGGRKQKWTWTSKQLFACSSSFFLIQTKWSKQSVTHMYEQLGSPHQGQNSTVEYYNMFVPFEPLKVTTIV